MRSGGDFESYRCTEGIMNSRTCHTTPWRSAPIGRSCISTSPSTLSRWLRHSIRALDGGEEPPRGFAFSFHRSVIAGDGAVGWFAAVRFPSRRAQRKRLTSVRRSTTADGWR